MLRTFVIGLGRAGAGLHVSVLSRLRERNSARPLFAEAPLVVCDPRFGSAGELAGALRFSASEAAGTALVDLIRDEVLPTVAGWRPVPGGVTRRPQR